MASSASPPADSAQASLSYNVPLMAALFSFAIAQSLKPVVSWYKDKHWDMTRFVGSGGMPSSHAATVMGLATSVGLKDGPGSSSFAVAIVLACVVMYDASGVRLHAGRQAEVLNQILIDLPPEHPLAESSPLKELLGHTPIQVVAGGILGCLVGLIVQYISS